MGSLEALSWPACNTCECRGGLVSNLLNVIYKGPEGGVLEVKAASIFLESIGEP